MAFMKSMKRTYFALIFFFSFIPGACSFVLFSFFPTPHLMLPGWVPHCPLQGVSRISFTFWGELENTYEIISHLCEVQFKIHWLSCPQNRRVI